MCTATVRLCVCVCERYKVYTTTVYSTMSEATLWGGRVCVMAFEEGCLRHQKGWELWWREEAVSTSPDDSTVSLMSEREPHHILGSGASVLCLWLCTCSLIEYVRCRRVPFIFESTSSSSILLGLILSSASVMRRTRLRNLVRPWFSSLYGKATASSYYLLNSSS
jgi:hypothetical protein